MKGIILAGGSGTRLYPLTIANSKQLMPLYDKPMIYYPISTLMLSGIRDILIITTESDNENFKKLLGNGSKYGVNISYAIQENPNGLAEALIIGEEFISNENVALILGDNFFYGQGFSDQLKIACSNIEKFGGGSIFGTYVANPSSYGVVEFNQENNVVSIEEKPDRPKSNYAVPGLYFFDKTVTERAKKVKPSNRGELEITCVIESYLNDNNLRVSLLGRGMAWLDTGTHDDLLEAANFVKTIQHRQGLYIGSLEEIGYSNGWLSKKELKHSIKDLLKTNYGQYLNKLIEDGE